MDDIIRPQLMDVSMDPCINHIMRKDNIKFLVAHRVRSADVLNFFKPPVITNVLDTQKNPLIGMVLLSTLSICLG